MFPPNLAVALKAQQGVMNAAGSVAAGIGGIQGRVGAWGATLPAGSIRRGAAEGFASMGPWGAGGVMAGAAAVGAGAVGAISPWNTTAGGVTGAMGGAMVGALGGVAANAAVNAGKLYSTGRQFGLTVGESMGVIADSRGSGALTSNMGKWARRGAMGMALAGAVGLFGGSTSGNRGVNSFRGMGY
jgi:hypothetical protein